MKRKILFLMTALAVLQMPVTVMAHGHGHGYGCGGHRAARTYVQCNVEGCSLSAVHEHDGAYYCGHFIGDGHDYHEICTVEGCAQITEHEHNGKICMPCSTASDCAPGYGCGVYHY